MQNMQRLIVALAAGLLVSVVGLIFVIKIESDQTQKQMAALATTQHMRQAPSQTVVYIQDGQGSQGVPYFDVPAPGAVAGTTYLPNFTPVNMICWQNDENGERWFRVRVAPGSTVRIEKTEFVRAAHTWNQTKTDKC